jgi:hypothetical protein
MYRVPPLVTPPRTPPLGTALLDCAAPYSLGRRACGRGPAAAGPRGAAGSRGRGEGAGPWALLPRRRSVGPTSCWRPCCWPLEQKGRCLAHTLVAVSVWKCQALLCVHAESGGVLKWHVHVLLGQEGEVGHPCTCLAPADHGGTRFANRRLVCPLGQCGWTPLLFAVVFGNMDATRLLLDRGAQLEAVTEVWARSLPTTCLAGVGAAPEVGGTLAAEKASVQRADWDFANMGPVCPLGQDGRTPLQLAAGIGHADVTRLLLDLGAQLEAADEVGPPRSGHLPGTAWGWALHGCYWSTLPSCS